MKHAVTTKPITLNDASRNIIMHHLGSFQDNDIEAVMADYTPESVLITQEATYEGTAEIQHFFTTFMAYFPKQQSDFELDKILVYNQLVYIVWHAATPSLDVSIGTDTFIIRDGKIHRQTFAGKMMFIN